MRTPLLTGRLLGHIVYALSVFPASGCIVGLTLTQTYEVLRHYDYGRRGAGFRGGRARTHVSPRLPSRLLNRPRKGEEACFTRAASGRSLSSRPAQRWSSCSSLTHA